MDEGEGVDDTPKDEDDTSLGESNVQEVIGLLLAPTNSQDDQDSNSDLNELASSMDKNKPQETLSISSSINSSTITVATASTTPLSISTVALTDTNLSLMDQSDAFAKALETKAVQFEDGTTAYVQAADDSDSCDSPAKFFTGQAIQLEDGSTAFIQATTRGLQAVQLEDGTTAFISSGGTDSLFDGDTSALDLEQLATSQALSLVNTTARFSSPRALALGEKAFRCPYEGCGRLYTTQHHLKVHERSHTGDRPFRCSAAGCGKAFATGYGLKSHTRVHTGEAPYKCPQEMCNKAFKTSGDLQKHVRTHTGERPFKCPFEGCDRAFTTSNIRKVHIRTHTGERPYVCKHGGCGRAFASATNYKNHIRIHTGEKPYVCTIQGCGKRFTEYSSLYKHHVVHTHSKPYLCTLCGKNYRQTSTLAMHKRTAHGLVDPNDDVTGATTISITRDDLDSDDGGEADGKTPKMIHFQLGKEMEDGTTNLVIQSATSQQDEDGESSMLQSQPQQILVVADPAQLMALQQLAQQANLGHTLTVDDLPCNSGSPTSIMHIKDEGQQEIGNNTTIILGEKHEEDATIHDIIIGSPITVTTDSSDASAMIAYTTPINDN